MGNFKLIPKEIKDQILSRIKNEGIAVSQLAHEHGVSKVDPFVNTVNGQFLD
jgi:transposase-like protein